MKECVTITQKLTRKDKPRDDGMNNMLESNAINYDIKEA